MAKAKTKDQDPFSEPQGLASELVKSIGRRTYKMNQHRDHTFGVVVPSLAFCWLIGGSNIFPCQRFLSISGPPKSLKSTLIVQIGLWHVQAGGLFYDIDAESKTSASMLEAMSWWKLTDDQMARLVFTEADSVDDWQKAVSKAAELAKHAYAPDGKHPQPPGQRIPIFVAIDSLTGKATEEEQEALRDEGAAESRGFPLRANKITRFIDALDIADTTMSVGYVRHLKQAIDGGGRPGMPAPMREGGGTAAAFKASLSLRMAKGQDVGFANHPAFSNAGTVSGYTLYLESNMSCLGPDKRKLQVDILWQYKDPEPGSSDPPRQIMLYDWDGALGQLLWAHKYDDHFKKQEAVYENDVRRLNEAIEFTASSKNKITCKALGLEGVGASEFGRAIEANPEARAAVSRFLRITSYPDVQQAELDSVPEKAA